MKQKLFTNLALAAIFCLGASFPAHAAGVRMRVVVLNPSATLTQSKDVRTALPKEITAKDIADDGGMELEYDNKEGTFYATKTGIELAPGETKVFEILLNDVWLLDEKPLEVLRTRVERIVNNLKETKAYERASLIAEGMYAHIDQIIKTQNNQNVTTNQHIAYYRDNMKLREQLDKDMAELEKLLVLSGGTVSLDAVEKADLNVHGPDSKTTWIIVFVILIFIGILGAVFYFTWQGQAGSSKTDKDAPPAASPFKDNPPGT